MALDTIIRNASVIDGTGADAVIANVGIEQDRIRLNPTESAPQEVDGAGLVVAPGFIDAHTHDDFAAILHPDMAFKLAGGVTSCIVGNCGMGAAPFAEAQVLARAFHPEDKLPPWQGYHGYYDYLDRHPPAVNIAALVGHGTLRMAAMGNTARAPDDKEMSSMKAILQEGLDAGAVGMSSGLVYDPGRHATTEELAELAGLMSGTDGLYATHMRDEGINLLDSINEAIDIGSSAGIGVQISHHKASGRAAWGLVTQSLALLQTAQENGLNIHADQYPYTAGSTILSAIYRNGRFGAASDTLTPNDVVIAAAIGHPEWEGQSIAAIAKNLQVSADVAAEKILEACSGTTVILHAMNEDDVQQVMRHPTTMIGSDGIPTLKGRPHPRLYGTFARVLGHYSRDLGLFSLPEAVYRMTGFTASKFKLADRGVIQEGAFADLVLFNPDTIIDKGTFAEPNQSPTGIDKVWVNGELAVSEGTPTPARGGRTLRRH